MSDRPIKLTAEEFEQVLFVIYKAGFRNGISSAPGNLKDNFDKLMFDLKFKTKK